MLSEPGASVTHPASHAELARGKGPPRPSFGTALPHSPGGLHALLQHPAGVGKDPPVPPPASHSSSRALPAAHGGQRCKDAAGRSLLTFFPCLCSSHDPEVLEEDASPALRC